MLTVVGRNRFLGSGRPDAAGFRQGKPPRLGLIESTDARATWADRSLSGEVDFHAIAIAQGTTYGLDAGTGRLLASTDNMTWETCRRPRCVGSGTIEAPPMARIACGPPPVDAVGGRDADCRTEGGSGEDVGRVVTDGVDAGEANAEGGRDEDRGSGRVLRGCCDGEGDG